MGSYLEEIWIDGAPLNIEALNKESLVVKYSKRENNICIINENGELLKMLDSYNWKSNVSDIKDLLRYNNKILYHENLNDTIFIINENSRIPWLYIDFAEKKISESFRNKIIKQGQISGFISYPPKEYMDGNTRYTENDDFIYFVFYYDFNNKATMHYVFYSKKTGSLAIMPPDKNLMDIIPCKLSYVKNIMDTNSAGQLIGFINPIEVINSKEHIIQKIEENIINTGSFTTSDFFESIQETSNPIIMLYSLKNSFN